MSDWGIPERLIGIVVRVIILLLRWLRIDVCGSPQPEYGVYTP